MLYGLRLFEKNFGIDYKVGATHALLKICKLKIVHDGVV